MALLKAEAEKLSNRDLVVGIVEEIIERDDLFALLPFVHTAAKSYDYVRENTLSEADFLDPNEAINEGAATFTEVSTRLRILAGDVDVDKFLSGTMSDAQSQVTTQLLAKAKGVGRKFRRTLAIGDSSVNSKEFDGVRRLTPAGQTFQDTTGAASAINLGALDKLKDMVPNGCDALMMRQGTWRAVRGLLRAMGGNTATHIMLPNYGYPVPAFDGTPVLINDYLPINETVGGNNDTCSVYALRLNETDGLHGIYGGQDVGIAVEEIGTVQNKDATRWRLKWYVGTALKSTKSIARMNGVTNI